MNDKLMENEVDEIINKIFELFKDVDFPKTASRNYNEITLCEHSGIIFDNKGNGVDFI